MQITSALMIAVFFVVLGRSILRIELRPWVSAWLANLGALAVTSIYWIAQPDSEAVFVALRAAYLFTKTAFVVLLALGVWTFVRNTPPVRAVRIAFGCVALYALAGGLLLGDIQRVGVAQATVMALFFIASAFVLIARRVPGSGWLAVGFGIRGVLSVIEAAAYATQAFATPWSASKRIGNFLAVHSSFDTGAEWMIALGCVLTLYRTIQQELTQSNVGLLAAQEVLQELVDRDSLTGLSNRRALPAVFRDSYETGATILFFDLNDFKQINDSYGHQAGDECLKRFARALQTSFRPSDAVIRYAGDEFVVIAPGSEKAQVDEHVEHLRERLKRERHTGPPIRFSVGVAYRAARGDAEAALRAADEAMYLDKAAKSRLRSA